MPPKGSTKAKPGAGSTPGKATAGPSKEPATPSKVKPEAGDDDPTATPTKPKGTPRVRKKEKEPEKVFNPLQSAIGDAAPVDISYENDSTNGKQLTDLSGYGQALKLRAQQPFNVITSIMLEEGQYAGHQAIIIAPSKPFPFLRLPKLTRQRIYLYYCCPSGKVGGKIEISGGITAVTTKNYSVGPGTRRLGLLRVNKEIATEARPILYSFTFRFDKSELVIAFLSLAGEKVRSMLTSIEIVNYTKAAGLPVMSMLSECHNIQRVHLSAGVGVNQNPDKAGKQFYNEAYRFLQTMGSLRGDKLIGLDILGFGKKCFTIKDDDQLREWDEDEVDDFTDYLRNRLR